MKAPRKTKYQVVNVDEENVELAEIASSSKPSVAVRASRVLQNQGVANYDQVGAFAAHYLGDDSTQPESFGNLSSRNSTTRCISCFCCLIVILFSILILFTVRDLLTDFFGNGKLAPSASPSAFPAASPSFSPGMLPTSTPYFSSFTTSFHPTHSVSSGHRHPLSKNELSECSPPTNKSSTGTDIDDLIHSYIGRHYPIRLDDCDKSFISAKYNCPTAIGNSIGPVLNAFLIAVIFDQPFLWKWSTERSATILQCDEFIQRKDWMFISSDLRVVCANLNRRNYHFDYQQDPRLACNLDFDLESRAITEIDNFQRQEAYRISRNFHLTLEEKERGDTLFGGKRSRAFGAAFHAMFTFTPAVRNPVDQLIASIPDEKTLIGIHLRHWYKVDGAHTQEFVDTYTSNLHSLVVDEILRICPNPASCALLLATDRESAVKDIKIRTNSSEGVYLMITTEKHHHRDEMHYGEHGSNTGLTAMQDLYLLSFSNHFIGTARSSFSDIIASFAYTEDGTPSELLYCDGDKVLCASPDENLL